MGKRSWAVPVIWAVLHVSLWLVPLAVLPTIMARLEVIFKDFGADLPAATLFTVRLSHLLVKLMPLVVGIVLALGVVDAFAIREFRAAQPRRWIEDIWIILMTIIPLGLFGSMALAVTMTWADLLGKLAG